MTLSEIHDLFEIEIDLQCKMRNKKRITIHAGHFLYMLTDVQQKIVDRLNLLKETVSIEVPAMTQQTAIALPNNFGKLSVAKIVGDDSNLKTTIDKDLYNEDGETKIIIMSKPATSSSLGNASVAYLIPFPTSAITLQIVYVINTFVYYPSQSQAGANWGTELIDETLSGNLLISDRYIGLLLLGMLGNFFPDKKQEFRAELEDSKFNMQDTHNYIQQVHAIEDTSGAI